MDHLGERTGEAVLRKHHGQVALDVAPLEEAERNLFERRARQLVANGEERMLRERHVRGPVGRQHEQPHLVEAAGQIVQHVDRGDVRPMQIVEEQDERAQPRRFQEERAELALHPFLRHGGRVLAHARDESWLDSACATCMPGSARRS